MHFFVDNLVGENVNKKENECFVINDKKGKIVNLKMSDLTKELSKNSLEKQKIKQN